IQLPEPCAPRLDSRRHNGCRLPAPVFVSAFRVCLSPPTFCLLLLPFAFCLLSFVFCLFPFAVCRFPSSFFILHSSFFILHSSFFISSVRLAPCVPSALISSAAPKS